MKKYLLLSFVLFILLCVSSCKTKQDIDYLKNIENVAINTSIQTSTFTIQPGDQLVILVTAKDNDVVKPFNQNYSSGDISQYSLSSSNLPMQGQTSVSGPTYIVDSKGDIDFPVIGVINTSGKNIDQFKVELKEKLKEYVKNPSVNIRTTNFKVTVLGEVTKTGTYLIPDGQPMTILGVLGMAGDLTIYGKRTNVLVIRNVNGETSKEYLNITDGELLNSPYYYVRQNDVIYVSPNNTKKNTSAYGPQATVLISIASVVVGVLALLFR